MTFPDLKDAVFAAGEPFTATLAEFAKGFGGVSRVTIEDDGEGGVIWTIGCGDGQTQIGPVKAPSGEIAKITATRAGLAA